MSDVHSLTLYLVRPETPGGVEPVTVAWNGHIELMEENAVPMPPRTYLWEMAEQERARWVAAIRKALE